MGTTSVTQLPMPTPWLKARERSPTASGLQDDNELSGCTSLQTSPGIGDAIKQNTLKVYGHVAIPRMLHQLSERRPRHVRRDEHVGMAHDGDAPIAKSASVEGGRGSSLIAHVHDAGAH